MSETETSKAKTGTKTETHTEPELRFSSRNRNAEAKGMNLLPEIRNRKNVAAAEDLLREPPLKRARSYLGDNAFVGASPLASSNVACAFQDLGRAGELIQAQTGMSYGTNLHAVSYRFPNESEKFISHSVSPASAFIDRHLYKFDQSQIHGTRLGLGLGLGSGPEPGLGVNLTQTSIPRIDDHHHYTSVPASSSSEGMRYKTKLCKHFIAGECKYRTECNFAHSIDELRKHHVDVDDDEEGKSLYYKLQVKSHVNMNLIKQPDNLNLSMMKAGVKPIKTKLCKYYQEGICRYNADCKFAHGKEELSTSLQQGTLNVPIVGSVNQTIAVNKPMLGGVNQTETLDTPMLGNVNQTTSLKTAVIGSSSQTTPLITAILGSVNQISPFSTAMSGSINQAPPFNASASNPNASTTFTTTSTSTVNTTLTLSTYASSSVTETSGSTSGPITGINAVMSIDDSSKDKKLKTKPCKFFQAGQCIYKEKCTFSHGEQDNVINGHGEVALGVAGNVGVDVNKFKECKFFLQGKCHFGEKCIYYHNSDNVSATTNNMANPKNRLCIWKEKGQTCPFGGKCVFAHSLPEIQNGTHSSTCSVNKSNVNTTSEMATHPKTNEVASFTGSYSYEITDTNWRPFQSTTVTLNLLGNDLRKENEEPASSERARMFQSGIYSSYTNLSYRTNWL